MNALLTARRAADWKAAYHLLEKLQAHSAQTRWSRQFVERYRSRLELPRHTSEVQLSIIMPVYNVAPYLDTSVQSVLNQSFADFELILVNDASTDASAAILEMYARLDPRIRLITLEHNTPGGSGAPSNIGLDKAKGQYVGLVDSDDFVTRDAFSQLVSAAERHHAEIVIGDFVTFDDHSRVVQPAYDKAAWSGLPLDKGFGPEEFPGVFRLSPVPWRKLYRRSFLEEQRIRFPSADLVYEDNALHWSVLLRAKHIVAIDMLVAYHRMAREGQTMTASQFRLSGIVLHANAAANELATLGHNGPFVEELFDYLYRQGWTVERQTDDTSRRLVGKSLANITARHLKRHKPKKLRKDFTNQLTRYASSYPDVDLTVVIPFHNAADHIAACLSSVQKLKDVSYNVLLIDDGSTDASYELCTSAAKDADNIHIFRQGNRGAGRARNALTPLCTGTYTYFLDGDDEIDANSLGEALRVAQEKDCELVVAQYQLEYPEEQRVAPMFKKDADIWHQLASGDTGTDQRSLAASLIAYPWTRLIKTSFLHDHHIFFGTTIVHNDVQFVWHGLAAASTIGFAPVPVCRHKKFTTLPQITNISDHRRLQVIHALEATYSRIAGYSTYPQLESQWLRFSKDLLAWAKQRVPSDTVDSFQMEAQSFLSSFSSAS
jgi:glycosyltransferase involved in cell wall biosynthesis